MIMGVDRSMHNNPLAMEYAVEMVWNHPDICHRSIRNIAWSTSQDMCCALKTQHAILCKALRVPCHNIYLWDNLYETDWYFCISILEFLLDEIGKEFSCIGAVYFHDGTYWIRILVNGISIDGHRAFYDNNKCWINLKKTLQEEFGNIFTLDLSADCLFTNEENNRGNYICDVSGLNARP